jgi:hypothetical protein
MIKMDTVSSKSKINYLESLKEILIITITTKGA